MDGVEEEEEEDDDLSCMTLTLKRETLSHTYFVCFFFFAMHCSDQDSWGFIKDFLDFLATHFLVIF